MQHVPPKHCCLLIELHGFTLLRNSLSSHHSENLNLTLKSSLVSLAPSFSVRSYLLALCKPGRAIELRAIHQSTSNTTRRVDFSKNWRTLMHKETSKLMTYCEKLSRYEMFGRTLMRILYQNWQPPPLLSRNRSFVCSKHSSLHCMSLSSLSRIESEKDCKGLFHATPRIFQLFSPDFSQFFGGGIYLFPPHIQQASTQKERN